MPGNGLFNIATPRHNENRTLDKSDMGISFGDVDSFVEPAPKNRARAPLVHSSGNARKGGEFTPILQTASKKNRKLIFETPGKRDTASNNSIINNSALTPVIWRTNRATPGADRSSMSANLATNSSPAQADLLMGQGGIREQEKAMSELKKENWELKLKLFLVEQQKHQSTPEHVQLALKENINYKVQVSSLSKDVAKYKRALAETEKKVASLGDQVSASIMHEDCPLPHGMSEEEKSRMAELHAQVEELFEQREDSEMKVREMEEEIEHLKTAQSTSQNLEEEIEDLTSRLSTAEATIKELEAAEERADQADAQITELEAELDSLKNKYEDLMDQTRSADNDEVVKLLRTQLDEKSDSLSELGAKLRGAERDVSSRQSQIDSLTKHISELETRNDDLEAELELATNEIQSIMQAKNELEVLSGTAEIKLAALEEEAAGLRATISQQAVEINTLQEELKERHEDIQELQGAAQDQSFEYRQLEQKFEQQKGDLVSSADATADKLEQEVTSARLALRNCEREIKQLNSKVHTLQGDLQASSKTNRGHMAVLTDQKGEKSANSASVIKELEGLLNQQRQQSQTAERESHVLQQKISTLMARSQDLEQQVRELERGDDLDTTQIQERLHEENQELREKIEDLEVQVREKEEELDLLGEEVSQINAELVDLRTASTSSTSSLEATQRQADAAKQQLDVLHRQLQASEDKIIVLERTRSVLQQELGSAKQVSKEHQEKAQALNTSLLNVRTLLSDTQASHKAELQALKKVHTVDVASLQERCEEVEKKLNQQLEVHTHSMNEAQAKQDTLTRDISRGREQIASLEDTVKRLSETEETMNVDQARFKDALHNESERHKTREDALSSQLRETGLLRDNLATKLTQKAAEMTTLQSALEQSQHTAEERLRECQILQEQLLNLEADLKHANATSNESETQRQDLVEHLQELENKISDLQNTLSATRREDQQQLLSKADELFAESQRVRELTDQISALASKLGQADQEKKRLMLALGAADQRLVSSSAKMAEMTLHQESLETQLERYTDQVQNTDAIESEKTRLRKELAATTEALRNTQVELEEVAAERDLLQEQADEAVETLEQYRTDTIGTIKSLREDLRTTQASLRAESETRSHLESTNAETIREETLRVASEHNRLNLQISDLQESLKLSKQSHADLLANIGSSDQQLISLNKALKALENTNEELAQRNKTLRAENEDNKNAGLIIDDLEAQLNDLEDELAQSKKTANAQYGDLEARLQGDITRKQKRIESLEEERTRLLSELEEARWSQEDAAAKRTDLENEIAGQRSSLQKLNKELQSLRHTSSRPEASHRSMNSSRDHHELQDELRAAQSEVSLLRKQARSASNNSSDARAKHTEDRLTEQVRDTDRKIQNLEGDLRLRERKISELKMYGKDKAERLATLERRYLTLQSQIKNNKHNSSDGDKQTRTLFDKQQKQHVDEINGLTKMIRYLRSRTMREESFRADLSYIKSYYDKQITSFEACNQANLAIIRQIGIYPDESFRARRPKLKNVAQLVLATVRMKNSAQNWGVEKMEKSKIEAAIHAARLRQSIGR